MTHVLRRLWVIIAVWVLAGCAGAPPAPAWRIETRNAVEQATAATLSGNDRVAEHLWRTAHQAASAAGQAAALARVALARCAVEQAALVWTGCPQAAPYLPQADEAERAYAAYLGVDGAAAEIRLDGLPPAHRPIAQRLVAGSLPVPERAAVLASTADPLARLVAGGVLWRTGGLDAAGVDVLVDTASEQGWRRPLAVWLAVRARLAEAAGDDQSAIRARQRLDWVLGTERSPPR